MVILHRCIRCGFVRANRLADDAQQGDDIRAIIDLMAQVTQDYADVDRCGSRRSR
jgi:hypothetical protein